MSEKTKAALTSFLRVLVGCVTTAVIAVQTATNRQVLDFLAEDWKAVAASVIGAALVTAYNWSRKGETRFGRGAQDIGMGGEDTLEPPDGVIQTPEGAVAPAGSRAARAASIRRQRG